MHSLHSLVIASPGSLEGLIAAFLPCTFPVNPSSHPVFCGIDWPLPFPPGSHSPAVLALCSLPSQFWVPLIHKLTIVHLHTYSTKTTL